VLDALRSSSGRRVLVVEDNRAAEDFAAMLLKELGYATLRARNAAEALGFLAQGECVDAVFSDIVMPGEMDGMALAVELRRRHGSIPVVLTTGYSARAANGGVPESVELLPKPYRMDELAAALQRAFAAAVAL
jgi:CheY-like chemotaxis protein